MSSQTPRRSWTSRITETWHSLLSWMRWRQRARAREQQREERLLRLVLWQVADQLERQQIQLRELELQQRRLLVEAMTPLAAALQRQDSLRNQQQAELKELLLEVLNSQQPSALTQLSPLIGLRLPEISSRSSVS